MTTTPAFVRAGAESALHPLNPGYPASASSRCNGPRSSPRTHPPAAAAAPTPATHRRPPRGRAPVRDRLVITPRQLRRATQRAGQIERLQDLHHFLRSLQARPPGRLEQQGARDSRPVRTKQRGDPMATHGDIRWPPSGTFSGRPRGDFHGRRQRHPQAKPAVVDVREPRSAPWTPLIPATVMGCRSRR
jgi:hypothetical protein